MTDRLSSGLARVAGLLVALAALAGADPAFAVSSQVSGSVFVDQWVVPDREVADRSPTGTTFEGAVRLGVDLSDELTFSAKACTSCHGIELDHVMLEYMPSTKLNLQVGRLSVPFGEFSNRIDQSGHKTTSSPLIYDMGRMAFGERSAMNLGVVALPYVDNGAMVYGQAFPLPGLQAWYGVYVVGGMKGSNDVDWISMRAAPYRDNNRLPSFGGRTVLTYGGKPGSLLGDVSLGGSFTGGRYDEDAKLGYQAYGADASMVLWKLTLRGEYAYRRTQLAPNQPYRFALVDDWFRKDGWYAEAEHPIVQKLSAVYRVDALRRQGVPLPGGQSTITPNSRINRYTAGLFYAPTSVLFAKVNYEYWSASDFPDFHSAHLGLGGAF